MLILMNSTFYEFIKTYLINISEALVKQIMTLVSELDLGIREQRKIFLYIFPYGNYTITKWDEKEAQKNVWHINRFKTAK